MPATEQIASAPSSRDIRCSPTLQSSNIQAIFFLSIRSYLLPPSLALHLTPACLLHTVVLYVQQLLLLLTGKLTNVYWHVGNPKCSMVRWDGVDTWRCMRYTVGSMPDSMEHPTPTLVNGSAGQSLLTSLHNIFCLTETICPV